jgi:hypothetical protein
MEANLRHAIHVALKLRTQPLSLPLTERKTCSNHYVRTPLEPPRFLSYLAVKEGVAEASVCEAERYVSTLTRSMSTWDKVARTPIPRLRGEPGTVDEWVEEPWRRVRDWGGAGAV